jgi:2-aminoethylphosphonate-pyruvate transaminase
MSDDARLAPARDPLLFTPGPLTTSKTVKQAMLRDVGSWDREFSQVVAGVRRSLLAVAGVSQRQGYEAVLMQGSGSFGLEAVVTSVTPPQGKLLVLVNGAYGDRIAKMAAMQSIALATLKYAESQPPAAEDVRVALAADPAITHVVVVHCETTSGMLNPIEPVGRAAKEFGKTFIVDAMSSFAAIPIDLPGMGIDFLVSSSNKCIEGVPGFSFVICRRDALEATEGWARSWCFNLLDQWRYMEKTGLFRCTPPTHVLLAVAQALRELEAEGGVPARGGRYRANHQQLVGGMRLMGFREFLPPELQSPIITTFLAPPHPNFDFPEFYDRLHDRGHVIYFGKVTSADCFRIGNIGRIFPADIDDLLGAIARTLEEMGVTLPCSSRSA